MDRRPDRPWSQFTQLERRRARRQVTAEFIADGWPAEQARIALLAEQYADACDPPPVPGGALPSPNLEAA